MPSFYGWTLVRIAVGLSAVCTFGGCIQRTITVRSNPPGALVFLNGMEVGRTPMTKEFLWYGNYDVELRLAGYQTLKTHADISAPGWQWIPLDFFTDLLPVTDNHTVAFSLQPQPMVDPQLILARGTEMQGMLESSGRTRKPVRHPSSQPTAATNRPSASTRDTGAH